MRVILKLFTLSSFLTPILSAQTADLTGFVYSAESNAPLPGADVLIPGTFWGAATDQQGAFRIENLPPGKYRLEVQMIGYQVVRQEVVITEPGPVQCTFHLKRKALSSPEIVVTGARRATRKMDAPVSIASLTTDQIVQRRPATIDEILPLESAIQIMDGQVNIRGSSGYARGAGSRVLVLVDGAPAISFDNGTIYWDALPVDELERIEILKGPGSALYGSSAMGGVLNLITNRIPARPRTKLLLGLGFYSKPTDARQVFSDDPLMTDNFRLFHSRRINRLGLELGFRQNNSDGYHQNGWYHKYIFDGKIDYDLAKGRALVSRFYYIDDDHGSFSQWRNASQPFHTPDNTKSDHLDSHKFQWTTSYVKMYSPRQSLTLRGNYFYTDMFNDFYNNDDYSKARTVSLEGQLDYRPLPRHYFTGGAEIKYNQVDADIWGTHHGYDAALFIQDEINPRAALTMTAGLRLDIHRIDSLSTETQVNPKFGLTYRPQANLALRGSIGWAFRAPAIAELYTASRQYVFEVKPNPNLQSERSISEEIGLCWSGAWFNLDVAVFSAQYKKLIEPLVDYSDYKIHFLNVTQARINGVEINADWMARSLPLQSKISYTYLDPRDLTKDVTLAYRHNHTLVVSEQVRIFQKIVAGIDYRYLSRIKAVQLFQENKITGADQRVPIHLVSVFCQLHPQTNLTVNISIENLFQYYYVTVERNIGAPRHLKFTFEYNL